MDQDATHIPIVPRRIRSSTKLRGRRPKRCPHGIIKLTNTPEPGAVGNLSRFSATPVVNVRPSASGIETQVRFVTRASERFALRNRLYQRLVEILQPSHKSEIAGHPHSE